MTSSAPSISRVSTSSPESLRSTTLRRPSEPAKATHMMGSLAWSALGILFWTLGRTSMSTATRLISGMGHWRSLAQSIMDALNRSSVLPRISSNWASTSRGMLQSSGTRSPSTTL